MVVRTSAPADPMPTFPSVRQLVAHFVEVENGRLQEEDAKLLNDNQLAEAVAVRHFRS